MNTIDERLHSILSTFEIDDRLIPAEALFSDDLGIPSHRLDKLVRTIEKDFSVAPPQSPRYEWNSIAGIRQYLHRHMPALR